MTAVMSSRVAENAVCWCEGRKRRTTRAKPRTWGASEGSGEFAIKGRFYTQRFAHLISRMVRVAVSGHQFLVSKPETGNMKLLIGCRMRNSRVLVDHAAL